MSMGTLQFDRRCCDMYGFGFVHVLLLLGALLVGSWAQFGSLAETTLRHLDQDTVSAGLESHVVYTNNMTAHLLRSRRSSDSGRLDVLGPSHLSALKDLLSDRKITVRLGLRMAVRGPSELLEPQLRLLLNKLPGLYNAGNKAGLFSMRVLEVKKVSTTP